MDHPWGLVYALVFQTNGEVRSRPAHMVEDRVWEPIYDLGSLVGKELQASMPLHQKTGLGKISLGNPCAPGHWDYGFVREGV